MHFYHEQFIDILIRCVLYILVYLVSSEACSWGKSITFMYKLDFLQYLKIILKEPTEITTVLAFKFFLHVVPISSKKIKTLN